MSTHRITPDTTIPFPCWLWEPSPSPFAWRYYTEPGHDIGFKTHYSTLPADRRPEDVVDEAATAPDPLAIAREAAAELCQYSDHPLPPSSVCRIIERHIKPLKQSTAALRAENERLSSEVKNLTSGPIHTCHDQCQRPLCVAQRQIDTLRAENARLQMELDASCNAEELRQVRAELTALRRDKERLDAAAVQAIETLNHGIPYYAYGENDAAVEMGNRMGSAITALSDALEQQEGQQ